MKVVLLAGGLGTRLQEETIRIPKPMVEIGDKPILWHIMKFFSNFNIDEFVIALGYKGHIIKKYFADYSCLDGDITVDILRGNVHHHCPPKESWRVHLVDTGNETATGGRLKRLKKIIGSESFLMTYGDGVADVDIDRLIQFHNAHGKIATVTAVHPPARFGYIDFENGTIKEFSEKSQSKEGWINGGFFVLEPTIFDYIENDETAFEGKPLCKLVQENQLEAYRHTGFWQCVDTLRELNLLRNRWNSGEAPWKIWSNNHDR